jgi:hypothetical protein
MRKVIIALPLLFVAVSGARAAGWKTATDHAQKCQTQVPGSWVPGEYNLGMKDPASTSTALVGNSRSNDLNMAKQVASSTYTVTKTFEDSPQRYWMAYANRGPGGGTNWYVAVATGSYICVLDLSFDSKLSDADAKTIATGLKKH